MAAISSRPQFVKAPAQQAWLKCCLLVFRRILNLFLKSEANDGVFVDFAVVYNANARTSPQGQSNIYTQTSLMDQQSVIEGAPIDMN